MGEGLTTVPSRIAIGLTAIWMAACGGSQPHTEPAAPGSVAAESPPAAAPVTPTGRVQLGTVFLLPGRALALGSAVRDQAEITEALKELEGLEGGVGTGTGQGTVVLRGGGGPGPGALRPAPHQVKLGSPTYSGSLDKNIIQRVIRSGMARIRYCFEKELLSNPSLSGRVTARFVIEPNGTVSQATAAGMGARMDTCVATVIRRLVFPAPPGGGRVVVSYPFVFNVAGSDSRPSAPIGDRLQEVARGCRPLETGGVASAFAPVERAAATCYQEALGRVPDLAGRAVVEVSVDDQGAITEATVQGPGDAALQTCIGAAVRALSLTGDQRVAVSGRRALFTLALTREPALGYESDPEAALITLTRREVRVGLRILASEVLLDRDAGPHRAVWREIASAVRGLKGPIVVRAADDVDALVVELALRTFAAARSRLRFARAGSDAGEWKIVSPLADLDLRSRCDGPPEGRNSVLVARDGYWIGTDKGSVRIPPNEKSPDSIAFARHLRELRRFELAGRSDLEIAAAAGTSYGALAKAVEIAFETGFTDIRVVRPSQLRDPRHLRRR